jgi:nucleoside-diphosphate-sugar epimerase
MKVLVTGATGVYGRSVVERLHRSGHEIVAVARNPPKALPPGVRFAAVDIQDLDALTKAMDGCEVVCHLAFVVTPIKDREESRRISVGGVNNVLTAMQRTGARRLVAASSAMSYGANPDNPPLFSENHEQRPAADYVYGTDKVAAERAILDSGIEAVIARTAVTVGRNIDNLLIDIFAGPSIVGIKDVDIRYQLVHTDDIGRFFAHACETGPAGPVNVSPPDFLPLHRIAEILGKRYVEVSAAQALNAIKFMWEHNLADITPGEAAGISYLPRMATDRLRDEWGFQCAWSTADSVLDLRRAVTGIVSVAKRRIELPWRLRFPTQRPGDPVVVHAVTARPQAVPEPGELDTPIDLGHPIYTAALQSSAALTPLTLSTYSTVLRAAVAGVLDAFGRQDSALSAVGAGVFGHRLYVSEDVQLAVAQASATRRRIVARSYAREVARLSEWAGDTLERASDPESKSDAQLDATLGALRDDLAWFWAIAGVGAALAGEPLAALDALLIELPAGVAGVGHAPRSAARAQAERTALALGRSLAAVASERARRLLDDPADAIWLTWDELLGPAADHSSLIKWRVAEHERLSALSVPRTISAIGASSAIATAETKEPIAV